MALSHSVRALINLKIIIKELIDNLGIDTKNLKFVSILNVYKDNGRSIAVTTSTSRTPT